MHRHYNRTKTIGKGTLLALAMMLIIMGWNALMQAKADAVQVKCWALCKPGAQVMVRDRADKNGLVVGYLEVGDSFMTDGESRNGWIRAYGVGDGGGWVYSGYVATDEPQREYENYICVAKKQVACRKWCGGPRIDGKAGWLKNGQNVQVFYRTEDWCVTSRGYIKTEWLEVSVQ